MSKHEEREHLIEGCRLFCGRPVKLNAHHGSFWLSHVISDELDMEALERLHCVASAGPNSKGLAVAALGRLLEQLK